MAIDVNGTTAGLVMQGLRASTILLSRLIVVLERVRADALADDDHHLAGEIGRILGFARNERARVNKLLALFQPQAERAADRTRATESTVA